MSKVLPNRLYLFLALKWVSPNFCAVMYLLFYGFILLIFKKKNKYINKQYNEPVAKYKHK